MPLELSHQILCSSFSTILLVRDYCYSLLISAKSVNTMCFHVSVCVYAYVREWSIDRLELSRLFIAVTYSFSFNTAQAYSKVLSQTFVPLLYNATIQTIYYWFIIWFDVPTGTETRVRWSVSQYLGSLSSFLATTVASERERGKLCKMTSESLSGCSLYDIFIQFIHFHNWILSCSWTDPQRIKTYTEWAMRLSFDKLIDKHWIGSLGCMMAWP